jgi:hypothetical protein
MQVRTRANKKSRSAIAGRLKDKARRHRRRAYRPDVTVA